MINSALVQCPFILQNLAISFFQDKSCAKESFPFKYSNRRIRLVAAISGISD